MIALCVFQLWVSCLLVSCLLEDGQLERFIIVLNFSGYDHHVDAPLSTNGVWQDLLNGDEYFVEDYRLLHHLINSNWGKVFYRKG